MITVSAIVPNYNETDNLRSCLDSLLAQHYEGLEIVLVDDGSDGLSRAICREYSNLSSSIHLIETENYGVSHARNVGISAANGEYITFVDSDDVVGREYIGALVTALVQSQADIAASRLSCLSQKPASPIHKNEMKVVTGEIAAGQFAQAYGWFCCGKLYKRSLFTSSGIRFNEAVTVCEDLLLNLEILNHCSAVVLLGEAGYLYRQREESATNKLNNIRWFDAFDVYMIALRLSSGNKPLLHILSFNCELMLFEAQFRLKRLNPDDRKTAEEKISRLSEALPSHPRYTVVQTAKIAVSRLFPNLVMKIRRRGIRHE